MSVTLPVSDRAVQPEEEAIAGWINREAIPLLKQLRKAVNDIAAGGSSPTGPAGGQLDETFPNPIVVGVTESSGPTELDIGAIADGDFLKRDGTEIVGESDVLPNVGPGAGSYGGGGDFVESVTLDAKGRVTAVSTEAPVSRDGSVFSMVGPAGAAAPIVAYDFTRFNSSLTLAQNLTAANQSGDSDYDLVAVGAPTYQFSATSIGGATMAKTWQPWAAHYEGGSLLGNSATNYAETSIHPSGLLLQGALTIEWFGFVYPGGPGGGSTNLVLFTGPGSTSADNTQYAIAWRLSTLTWTYFHENGSNVESSVGLLASGSADETGDDQPRLVTLTRDGAGLCTLYLNGRRAAVSGTAAASALPDGGSAGKLQIGRANVNATVTLGVRIFGVALTGAQAQASYRRTFFGVSA